MKIDQFGWKSLLWGPILFKFNYHSGLESYFLLETDSQKLLFINDHLTTISSPFLPNTLNILQNWGSDSLTPYLSAIDFWHFLIWNIEFDEVQKYRR